MGHFITDRLHSKGDGSAFYPYGESKTGAAGDDREQFATYTRDQSSGLDYADQRWYSSRLGRFTNPDPIQAGNAMLLTANWNKFTYVSGNPVNKNDPRGICSPQDVPPCYSIDGIDNPETPGGLQGGRLAVGGEDGMFEVAVGDGEGSPGLAAVGAAPDPPSLPNPSRNWTEANRALESTREFLSGISYSALSSDCKSALSSIGSQFTGNPLSGESLLAQVKAASERAQFHDIKKSQHYYADLYKNTLAYSVVLAQYGSMTIQTHFASYPGEHVLSQLLGHNIYFANEAVSRTSTARNSSLLFHELIHNLGRDDADLKRALGIPIDWNSSWISYRLFERCFK
jgi:RHS repeat-associated protein